MTDPTTAPTAAPTTELPYRYFVSYASQLAPGGLGFGNINICSSRAGTDPETVDEFRHTISRAKGFPADSIVVLNYQPLDPAAPAVPATPASLVAEQALRDLLAMVDQFDTPRDPGRVQAFVRDVRQVALRGLGHTRG